MHGFANATSSHYKRDNWEQLQRFCVKQVRAGRAGRAGGRQQKVCILYRMIVNYFINKRGGGEGWSASAELHAVFSASGFCFAFPFCICYWELALGA